MRSRRFRLLPVGVALAALTMACGEANDERDASSQPQGARLRVTLGTQEFPRPASWASCGARRSRSTATPSTCARASARPRTSTRRSRTVTSTATSPTPAPCCPSWPARRSWPRPRRDLRGGEEVLRRPGHGHERDDAVREQGRDRHHERRSPRRPTSPRSGTWPGSTRSCWAPGPSSRTCSSGWRGLQEVYGLDNATFAPIELGQQYAALDNGEADAVDAFTTDPQLETGDYTLLDDPELLFGSQNVVMVCGEDKLDRSTPTPSWHVVDAVNARADRGGHGADERRGHRRPQ